jgi:hypothetical protein
MKKIIKKIKKNWKLYLFYAFIFVFIFILSYYFPYSNDDWVWGSKIGIERFENGFKDYNGRYLGNTLVLVLTRSNLLKSLFMTITYFGIGYLIKKIVNKNNNGIMIFSILMLFLINRCVFRETIVNTSGFINYSFNMFLVLIFIAYIKDVFKKVNFKEKWYNLILLFLLGLSSTLFMEHITTYLLVLCTALCVYSYIKYKKIPKSYLIYFAGVIIGSIIMFSNGAYMHVVKGDDFYRTVTTKQSMIVTMARNYFNKIQNNAFSLNLITNLVVSILMIILTCKFIDNNKISKWKKYFLELLNLISIFYSVFLIVGNYFDFDIVTGSSHYFVGFMTAIYCLALLLIILLIFFDKKNYFDKVVGYKLLFYMGSVVIVLVPLLVLTPVGHRCSLPALIFYILFASELYNLLIEDKNGHISKILFTLLIIVLSSYLHIYHCVYLSNNERYEIVKKQVDDGMNPIYIRSTKYDKYIWKNNPVNDAFDKAFLLFNGFDVKAKVEVLKPDDLKYKLLFKNNYKYKNLMVVAHPDDDLLFGGTELMKDDYVVVCVTCGTSKTRLKEFKRMMNYFEDEYITLGYPDLVEGKKSEWTDEYDSITRDIKNIINLKEWDKIVTHNPDGEYGHIHHKMTNRIVTGLTNDKSKLYYFNKTYSTKYYKENNISKTLDEEMCNKKRELFDKYYKSQVGLKVRHLSDYEKVTSYDEWINNFTE